MFYSGLGRNLIHVTGLCNEDTKKDNCVLSKLQKKDVIRLHIHSVKKRISNRITIFKIKTDILVTHNITLVLSETKYKSMYSTEYTLVIMTE